MSISLGGGAFVIGGILSDGTTTQFSVDLSLPPYNYDFKGNMPFLRQDIPPVVTVLVSTPPNGAIEDPSFLATATLNKYVLAIMLNKPIPVNANGTFWSASFQFPYAFHTL